MLQNFRNYYSQSIHSRYFIHYFIFIISIFLVYHALLWVTFTSKLLNVSPPQAIGDLSRIGYLIQSTHPRTNTNTLPRKHIEFSEWKGEHIDVITLGDSFSNGGGSGKNRFYQDYLASYHDLNVMNIKTTLLGDNYIETIIALEQSGLLARINPKAILIESVGRHVINRFSKPIQWKQTLTQTELYKDINKSRNADILSTNNLSYFISTANYKLPLYNIGYHFSPNAFGYSDVFKLPLKKPFFSVQDNATLLVYYEDISVVPTVTPQNVVLVNDNFNRLAQQLAKKDIRLLVMIAVDKYDLYYNHIHPSTIYPHNPLFDLLRPLKKEYTFIDTKKILSNALNKGEMDIYYADDTHWSHKASDTIIRTISIPTIKTKHND
jgi:hypothetical protein